MLACFFIFHPLPPPPFTWTIPKQPELNCKYSFLKPHNFPSGSLNKKLALLLICCVRKRLSTEICDFSKKRKSDAESYATYERTAAEFLLFWALPLTPAPPDSQRTCLRVCTEKMQKNPIVKLVQLSLNKITPQLKVLEFLFSMPE